MQNESIRNVAIVAHVDHGKTTLVDGLLRQTGTFRENQAVDERVLDNMDLERERGITILAKNTAVWIDGVKLNIVDTPGHADFGGEVERSLHMVDGALLLVDASEGPLPQTRFVLRKALARRLPIVLVVNKIDRKDARIQEVVNEVYDLFIDLDANESQLDFPIIYTNAREGVAHREIGDDSTSLLPLLETIVDTVPAATGDPEAIPQFLVTNLDYDPYVGRLALGRLFEGTLTMNAQFGLCREDGSVRPVKFSALDTFSGLKRTRTERVGPGDICAIAGIEDVHIGDSITSLHRPSPLPRIHVDEPTVSMLFCVNSGPFAGRDGKLLTSRQIRDRLEIEQLGNVAIEMRVKGHNVLRFPFESLEEARAGACVFVPGNANRAAYVLGRTGPANAARETVRHLQFGPARRQQDPFGGGCGAQKAPRERPRGARGEWFRSSAGQGARR